MASGNEPGLLKIMVERSGFGMKELYTVRSDSAVHAGKSPDGVAANVTIDKLLKISKLIPTLTAGDIVHLMFKPDASDGIDASDCIVEIPFYEDGQLRQLNKTDLGFTTDLHTLVADAFVELGTGYTVPNNVKVAQLGGGAIVLSIEDDA